MRNGRWRCSPPKLVTCPSWSAASALFFTPSTLVTSGAGDAAPRRAGSGGGADGRGRRHALQGARSCARRRVQQPRRQRARGLSEPRSRRCHFCLKLALHVVVACARGQLCYPVNGQRAALSELCSRLTTNGQSRKGLPSALSLACVEANQPNVHTQET